MFQLLKRCPLPNPELVVVVREVAAGRLSGWLIVPQRARPLA